MTYVALQRMTLADGRSVDVGDDVPEAETWPDATPWVHTGHIAYVADGSEQKFRDALAEGQGAELIATAGTLRSHLEAPAAYLRHKRGSAEAIAKSTPTPASDADKGDAADAESGEDVPQGGTPNKGNRRRK